jgi:predicted DNA-binding transcriptional regulator YafY
MDILKYGSDCEVIEPQELANRVKQQLKQALANYAV